MPLWRLTVLNVASLFLSVYCRIGVTRNLFVSNGLRKHHLFLGQQMRVGLSMNNSPVDIDNNSHIDIIVLVVRVLHVHVCIKA